MRVQSLLCVALAACVLAGPAMASATSATNDFPDPTGIYYSVNTGFYLTPGGLVTLEGLVLSAPTGSITPPAAPGGALWAGGFEATAFMSFFGGGTLLSFTPVVPSAASITGTGDAPPLHTYTTEMLSLDLAGLPFGAMIRESPTIPSPGGHTVTEDPPIYHIDSFFDVFTELSLDGGDTWTPATGPIHIQNPEPGSMTLLASAAAMLLCRRKR